MSRVLGIDPSLSATGIATENQTSTLKTLPGQSNRLSIICNTVRSIVAERYDLAVVEDLPTHAHGAGKTGMAQGAVRVALESEGVLYVTVSAATLKKFATGKGNATKADMRMALYQRAGIDLRDDNQVDAWWLREIGLHHVGAPTVTLPKTHTAALEKVTGWPPPTPVREVS